LGSFCCQKFGFLAPLLGLSQRGFRGFCFAILFFLADVSVKREPSDRDNCVADNTSRCWPIFAADLRRFIWTERPFQGRGTSFGGRTMLLNNTIQALIASTQALAATVIAELFVGSASPAIFAVVPKQIRMSRVMRWRSLPGQPVSDSKQCCGDTSPHCHRSLSSSLSRLLSNTERALNQGSGCLTGTSGRS
jgi:hypothetical protein